METVKVRKVGNSLGLLLNGEVLRGLGVKEDSLMSIAVIEGAIVLRPMSAMVQATFQGLDALGEKHYQVLKDLS